MLTIYGRKTFQPATATLPRTIIENAKHSCKKAKNALVSAFQNFTHPKPNWKDLQHSNRPIKVALIVSGATLILHQVHSHATQEVAKAALAEAAAQRSQQVLNAGILFGSIVIGSILTNAFFSTKQAPK